MKTSHIEIIKRFSFTEEERLAASAIFPYPILELIGNPLSEQTERFKRWLNLFISFLSSKETKESLSQSFEPIIKKHFFPFLSAIDKTSDWLRFEVTALIKSEEYDIELSQLFEKVCSLLNKLTLDFKCKAHFQASKSLDEKWDLFAGGPESVNRGAFYLANLKNSSVKQITGCSMTLFLTAGVGGYVKNLGLTAAGATGGTILGISALFISVVKYLKILEKRRLESDALQYQHLSEYAEASYVKLASSTSLS